jgi:hypothetical protein
MGPSLDVSRALSASTLDRNVKIFSRLPCRFPFSFFALCVTWLRFAALLCASCRIVKRLLVPLSRFKRNSAGDQSSPPESKHHFLLTAPCLYIDHPNFHRIRVSSPISTIPSMVGTTSGPSLTGPASRGASASAIMRRQRCSFVCGLLQGIRGSPSRRTPPSRSSTMQAYRLEHFIILRCGIRPEELCFAQTSRGTAGNLKR